ncbi:TatD family hydrolase, partial [Bordetella pseudohinzii]|uniref:TatD family hydrolase n=1 Tax=Bordetella pseudohinzii TaxID=1331258 RepID=UPI0019185FB7
MLIDTHCHLDAAEFDADRMAVARQARASGGGAIVIPAVERANFAVGRELAHAIEGGAHALGIHPLDVGRAGDEDLAALRRGVGDALPDP